MSLTPDGTSYPILTVHCWVALGHVIVPLLAAWTVCNTPSKRTAARKNILIGSVGFFEYVGFRMAEPRGSG